MSSIIIALKQILILITIFDILCYGFTLTLKMYLFSKNYLSKHICIYSKKERITTRYISVYRLIFLSS